MNVKDLDNVDPETRAQVISDVRKALPEKISDYCSETDIWRFSVARQLDVQKSKEMIEGWYEWRMKENIDDLRVPQPENDYSIPYPIRGYSHLCDSNLTPGKDIEESLLRMDSKFGGGCYHKVDKKGHPVYIDRMGYYDIKGIPATCTIEELTHCHFLLQEFALKSIMKSCSKDSGQEISKQTVIFDLKGVGIKAMYWPALTMLKDMLKYDQLYFPESMYKTFFVNVPSIFVTLWNIIKNWLDPRVLSKIEVCGKRFTPILLEHIDADNLPSFLGGNCCCEHIPGGCVPSPNKNLYTFDKNITSDLPHKSSLSYENFTHSYTYTTPTNFDLPETKPKKSSGWFTKTDSPKPLVDRYVILTFSTSSGRGIVVECMWKPAGSESIGAEPELLYPERMFESQRAPVILEIKLPKDKPIGEMIINFRLPRADEGASPLPSVEESKHEISLEYSVKMEAELISEYGLTPVNRNFDAK
ncbi:hypothetical protein BB559_002680 [Furculomyces boomerangus]|uniref:CRAL-TRIO domain-containing protein n=1 Tax=Furculomyces boomerangus TaxID=61424 RepID=A0A2T9YTD0_9FUNG|nr:hypothetical protein BB559_002680 [Furculomyces boomerangus]